MRHIGGIRPFLGTLLGGLLVGFVGSALVGGVLAGDPLAGRSAESPVARTYIAAVLNRDVAAMESVRPPRSVAKRAETLISGSLTPDNAGWMPLALSYVGGGERGPVGVHVYVAEIRPPDGSTPQLVPFALTVVEGKVVRVQ